MWFVTIHREKSGKEAWLTCLFTGFYSAFCLRAESHFVALDWLRTHYADQAALGLRHIPASASQMLGLK